MSCTRPARRTDATVAASRPQLQRRRLHEIGDAGRTAAEAGGRQVGEVAHRGERAVDRRALELHRRGGLAGEDLVPHRPVLEREQLVGAVRDQPRELGVERRAGALAHDPRGVLGAAEHALQPCVVRHLGDPQRQRDLVALGAAERPLAVPAVGQVGERPDERLRHVEPPREQLGDLAHRGHVRLEHAHGPGNAGGQLQRACRRRRRGIRQRAQHARRTPRAASRASRALGARPGCRRRSARRRARRSCSRRGTAGRGSRHRARRPRRRPPRAPAGPRTACSASRARAAAPSRGRSPGRARRRPPRREPVRRRAQPSLPRPDATARAMSPGA